MQCSPFRSIIILGKELLGLALESEGFQFSIFTLLEVPVDATVSIPADPLTVHIYIYSYVGITLNMHSQV